jgi:hypothetical protein
MMMVGQVGAGEFVGLGATGSILTTGPLLSADVTTHTGGIVQVVLPEPAERADGCLVFLVPSDAWWVGGEVQVRLTTAHSIIDGTATFSARVADVIEWWSAEASARFDQLDDAVVMTFRPALEAIPTATTNRRSTAVSAA